LRHVEGVPRKGKFLHKASRKKGKKGGVSSVKGERKWKRVGSGGKKPGEQEKQGFHSKKRG